MSEQKSPQQPECLPCFYVEQAKKFLTDLLKSGKISSEEPENTKGNDYKNIK